MLQYYYWSRWKYYILFIRCIGYQLFNKLIKYYILKRGYKYDFRNIRRYGTSCPLVNSLKNYRINSCRKDQDHLHIIIDNNTNIPDRTEYILGKGKDPRIELIRSAIRLESIGADYIAIPCNTAHYFYDDIIKYTKVKILNMIQNNFLKTNNSENKNYLLLATEGTYQAKIYDKTFNSSGLNILTPNDKDKRPS